MEPRVSFEVFDLLGKEADVAASASQPFAPPSEVIDGYGEITDDPMSVPPAYATGEPGVFRLDGTIRLLPAAPVHTGWWSAVMSGSDGVFTSRPAITISYAEAHESAGITVYFDSTTCLADFAVEWSRSGSVVSSATITDNASSVVFVPGSAKPYDRIVITAIRSDRPYRYAKIQEIDFGQRVVYDSSVLLEATVIEEAPLLPTELPVGALDISVIDEEQRLNILQPDGIFRRLRQNQRLIVEAGSAGGYMPFGVYYLSGWQGTTASRASLSAVTIIGLMDRRSLPLSVYYASAPADQVLRNIFAAAGVEDYNIHPSLSQVRLTGPLPSGSCRIALQHVCLACGATVSVGRDGVPTVAPPPFGAGNGSLVESMGEPGISQTEYVSSVEIPVNQYIVSGSSQTIAEVPVTDAIADDWDTYMMDIAGRIDGNYLITDARISSDGHRSAIRNVSGGYNCLRYEAAVESGGMATLTLIGRQVTVVTSTVAVTLSEQAGATVVLDNIPLITQANIDVVKRRLSDYYTRRLLATVKITDGAQLHAGDCVQYTTDLGVTGSGYITRLSIDMGAGTAEMEVLG